MPELEASVFMGLDRCGVSPVYCGREGARLTNKVTQAPVNEYIRYKPHSFYMDESHHSVEYFPAHPSEETEAAWANLFESKW